MIPRMTARAPNPSHVDSVVACTIGDEQFALRGADACEIVRAERVRRSEGVDGAVGTLYVNRERVPVYPLAAVLDRPRSPAASQPAGNHVVVTHGSAGMVGWLVDRVGRPALADDAAHVIPLPATVGPIATRWFEGLVRIGDRSLLLVSPPNLDPRGSSRPTPRDARVDPFAGDPVRLPDDVGPPLVLLFSSPALPPCRATRFALSARQIAAVIRSQPLTMVPGCARHVTGVIIWRDAAVPVIDSRGETDRRAGAHHDRLVVARCGRSLTRALVAFPIGADVTLHQPTRADRQVADSDDTGAAFVAGVFSIAGHPVALLDLDAALTLVAGGSLDAGGTKEAAGQWAS